ncbi:MAG: PorT family protein [Saprospiraceae bacterium]|nr:PorT family protein [Saprospiraceae bacterium]
MKKTIILCVALIFILKMNYAQNEIDKFKFGLKATPTLAWLKPDNNSYEKDGSSLGFAWGAVAEFYIAANYAISTGVNITYSGGSLKYPHQQLITPIDTAIGTLSRKYSMKYLEIPLVLKMKTNEIGYLSYYGLFGIGSSFNLSAKAKDDFSSSDLVGGQLTTDDIDIKKDVSFFRESLIIGLGVEYSLGGRTCLMGGITFNNGFTDILKGNNSIDGSEQKAISNYIELNIGILF